MTDVMMQTSAGDIRIRLFTEEAPETTANFLKLVDSGFYNGLHFHRVIEQFMIQGGDPLGNGTGNPGYKFADEFHGDLFFDRPYILAMANSGPNTNGSQFFITVDATPHLNRKHTIFGEVKNAASQAVVLSISTTPTVQTRPLTPIIINSITVAE